MPDRNIIYNVYHFYREGFRNMTIGRTLWTIIIIKLIVIFAILKIFFFPDVLGKKRKAETKRHMWLES